MWTTEDQTVAAGRSVDEIDPACWQEMLEELWGRVAGRFGRADLRWRARALVGGLLAELPRKNCWTIAEHAGDSNPDGMQHLLARAVWDHDAVRDAVRDYVVEHFDRVDHDRMIKAVEANTDLPWVVLYVRRWLAAPVQHPDGTLQQRDRGTPQGSAVSPVLANLFLHYAFDAWMARRFPTIQFERYADDGVPRTLKEAPM
jgi:hypothetical protein